MRPFSCLKTGEDNPFGVMARNCLYSEAKCAKLLIEETWILYFKKQGKVGVFAINSECFILGELLNPSGPCSVDDLHRSVAFVAFLDWEANIFLRDLDEALRWGLQHCAEIRVEPAFERIRCDCLDGEYKNSPLTASFPEIRSMF
jgi:hypothetical protein